LQDNLYKMVKNNLYVGLVIKNYKLMCQLLNEKEKNGKGRNYQFKKWQQYFEWEKQGYKFVIIAIHEEPILIVSEKGNNIYNIYIEKLILDLLVQKYQSNDEFNQRIYLSRDQMLESLNMVNRNYHYVKYNAKDTANYIEVDMENIKEFFDINNRNFNNAVERALKRLSNRFLVNWQIVQTVAIKVEEEEIYKWNKNEFVPKEIHRDATKEERELILLYESIVAEEMGFDKKQNIYLCGKWLEFTDKVCKKLQEQESNILYYYKSYDIIFHEKVIQELDKINQYLLEHEERKDTKNTLNNTIIEQIEKNTKKRHEEAKEKLPPVLGKRRVNKWDYEQLELVRRSNNNYIPDTNKITDTVINQKTKYLVNNIIKYNYEQKKKLNKEVDNLLYGDDK